MGLKLEHVSYLYGTDTELLVRALDDVSLSIEEGEFLAIVVQIDAGEPTSCAKVV